MALIDKASLLMVPSTYEDGTLYNVLPSGNKAPDETGSHNGYDQTRADFTFSRGSNLAATRVNASGLIEKGRENLLTYSNDFSNAAWTKVNATLTSGQTGYDGTNNAWKISSSASGSSQIFMGGSNTNLKTHSIYAKAGSVDVFKIWVGSNKEFNLSNGTTSSSNSKITDVGNGWFRCEVFDVFSNYNPFFTATTAGDYIYIQNAQLEQGLVSTPYIETGSTTAQAGILEDMPRINYDANGENGALLLEPQRTNSIANSEYTDGSNWSNEGSITDEENTSETTSPEGLYNAVKLVSANATSEQWIQTTGVQTTNATDCTISCFVKKSDYDYFHIRFTGINGAFAAGSVWFNIAEGSVGTKQTGILADIKDYGNGWYRISATKEATATTTAGIRFQLASSDNDYNVVGDGVKGTYIYGCQAEIGSHVSSYVPTYGSAATRGADSCSVTGVSDVIGQSEGTIYGEIDFQQTESAARFIAIGDGTANNRISIFTNSSNNVLI